jgi:hypothetical protein
MPEPYRVFFSHGGGDTYIVNNFLRPRVEGSGARVFVDAGEIRYGDDFRRTVLDELDRCHELLVLLTPTSVERPWVFAEIGAALVRGVRVVVLQYGVTEERLHALGILSLLGTNKLLVLDNFDNYVSELKVRVENGRNA